MEKPKYSSALIVGAGPGLSASLARLFARNGLKVAVAARQTDKLAALAKETGAQVHTCNAADAADVAKLFDAVEAAGGAPDVVVYNASSRVRGSIVDLGSQVLLVTADGHYRVDTSHDPEFVYVVQTSKEQLTLKPADFTSKFRWKNAQTIVKFNR